MKVKGNRIPIEQNTPEWHEWRAKGIGGSEAAVLKLGDNYPFDSSPETLFAQKLGLTNKKFNEAQQAAIARGHALEPLARDLFVEQTEIEVEPACFEHPHHPYLKASMDGITKDGRIGVEIKAPGARMYRQLLEKGIPDYYYAQVQHQLYVTGADGIFFWAYNQDDEFKNRPTYLQYIKPNHAYIEELVRLEIEFWKMVENRVPPTRNEFGQFSYQHARVGVVAFGGYALNGKDTFGEAMVKQFNATHYRFANRLKDVAVKLGLAKGGDKNKARDRDAYIKVAKLAKGVYRDVWVEPVVGDKGFASAAVSTGVILTDWRHVNEYVRLERAAAELGVPFRSVWVQRPDGKPYSEEEASKTSHLRDLADIRLWNDFDLGDVNSEESQLIIKRANTYLMTLPSGTDLSLSHFVSEVL